ncbi:MAG: SMC family ATPase [bacterium]|jgi:exonuclease SbcC|nr:SMC family ATPase [candidate division KSB1 bacterium]MDH7561217.1 SMC family ATPase [bacterium]
MVIQTLRLRNYRRFRTLELEFPENVIGIIGRNGVGKTTIVEALGWALYGNRVKRTDKTDIRSQFASPKEVCAAELLFTCGGEHYRIVRQLRGKDAIAEAAAYRGAAEAPVAVLDTGVTEFIENLLGLDYQSFFASVFAQQKELDALSRLKTPAERLKCINRLINIDLVDRARELARQDWRDRSKYVEGLRKGLKDEALLRQNLAQAAAALQEKRRSEETAKAALAAAKEALHRAKNKLDALSATRDRFMQLSSRRESLTQRLAEAEQSLRRARGDLATIDEAAEKLRKIAPLFDEIARVRPEKERMDSAAREAAMLQAKKEELARLRPQMAELQRKLADLREKAATLQQLGTDLQQARTKISHLEKEVEQAEEQLRQVAADREAIAAKGREVRGKREQVEKLGPSGPCPVCTRPLGEQHAAVLHRYDEELKQLREEYHARQQQEELAKQGLAQLKRQLTEMREAERGLALREQSAAEAARQLQEVERQLTQWDQHGARLEEEIASLSKVQYDQTTHQALKRRLDELLEVEKEASALRAEARRRERVAAEISRLEASVQDLTAQLAEVEQDLAGVAFDEDQYRQAQQLVERCSQEQDQQQEAHTQVREERAALEKGHKDLVADLEEHRRQVQEIATAEEEMHYLELLDHHFDCFRQELANRLRPLIASRASELLRLTTEGRYSLLELDEDYTIRLYDGTTPYQLERFSGGEQDLTNLCLRIAISQVVAERSGVTPMNLMVLDEIFGSQDEQRRQLILSALNQLSTRFRQIFIITHIEDVRDSLPVVIGVEQENEQESVARFL